jgi:hypothetical protein
VEYGAILRPDSFKAGHPAGAIFLRVVLPAADHTEQSAACRVRAAVSRFAFAGESNRAAVGSPICLTEAYHAIGFSQMLTGHNPIIVIEYKDSRHGKPGEESFP